MLQRPAPRIIAVLAALLSAACSGEGGTPPPTEPENVMTWLDVSAGLGHTCGVNTENVAYCWGSGSAGQLGSGATPVTAAPTAVAGSLRFRSIGAGNDFSCGLTTDGQVYCWGSNSQNQLGDGTTTNRPAPVPVPGMTGVRELFVGASGVYVFTEDDRRLCWGAGCKSGIEPAPQPTPAEVGALPPLRGVASRGPHWCGASRARGVVCWGPGQNQSLGPTPTGFDPLRDYNIVLSGTGFRGAATGSAHSCGVVSNGQVFCWGNNAHGQLGVGLAEPAPDPAAGRAPTHPAIGGHAFAEIFAGGVMSCGLTADGTAFCWGSNAFGQVGADSSRTVLPAPTRVAGGHKFTRLSIGSADAAGRQHVCGITVVGRLYCWGSGVSGGAGPGIPQYATAPEEVDDPA